MNKIYKVIYSKVRQCYVVVSEIAKSHGRNTKSSVNKSSAALTAAVLFALGAVSFADTSVAQAADGTESIRNNDYVGANGYYWYFDEKKNQWTKYPYKISSANNNRSWKELPNYEGGGAKEPGAVTAGLYAQAGEQTVTIGNRNAGQSKGSVFIGELDGYNDGGKNDPVGMRNNYVTAVGFQSNATGWGSIAIGSNAVAENTKETSQVVDYDGSAGTSGTVQDDNYGIKLNPSIKWSSVALGYSAKAKDGNIAIGAYSDATDTSSATPYVSVGNSTLKRRITNVADGTGNNDVATVGQMNKAIARTGGSVKAGWGINKAADNTISVKHNLSTGSNAYADRDASGLILGGSVSERKDSKQYGASTETSVIVGAGNALASGAGSVVAGGLDNVASGANSTVVGGDNNNATASQSAVFGGRDNTASGTASMAGGGIMNVAQGQQSMALGGAYNYALGTGSVAIGGTGGNGMYGYSTSVNGGYSVSLAGGSTGADALNGLAAGNQSVVTTANGTAVGYQATTDEAGTIAFGHDAGDVSGYTVTWKQRADGKTNADFTTNDYTQAPESVTKNKYTEASYNRLVKVADGVNDHDVVVMEQLKNASGVGSNIKVYKTDENGNVQFDENNNPIENTSATVQRDAAREASKTAWGNALGADTFDKSADAAASDQLITGKTLYNYDKPVAKDGKELKTVSADKTTGQNLAALDATLNDSNHNIKYYSVNDNKMSEKLPTEFKGYSNEGNDGAKGMGSIAAGFVTHADGIASTVAGSYSGIVNSGDKKFFGYDLRGATALSYGTLNVNKNDEKSDFFSGVANSIIGQANATTNSNAAIIYGAGNTVTNSYRNIDLSKFNVGKIISDVSNPEELAKELQKAVPTSGGQVMVMGGGNAVNNAYMTQVTGVGNKVTGTQTWSDEEKADNSGVTQLNFIDGFYSSLENGHNDYMIGAYNKLKDSDSTIIFGDNNGQKFFASSNDSKPQKDNINFVNVKDSIAIGSNNNFISKADKAHGSLEDVVAVGNNNTVSGSSHAIAIGDQNTIHNGEAWQGDPKSINSSGNVAIGYNTKIWYDATYGSDGESIVIGKNASAYNPVGTLEKTFNFGNEDLKNQKSGFTGSIAIGENAFARSGSTTIGVHRYKGTLGDINVDPTSTPSGYSGNNGVGNSMLSSNATTVGNETYNNGVFSTAMGSYTSLSGLYSHQKWGEKYYGLQNFGAAVIGSLDSVESLTSTQGTAGMADSILGSANRTQNANGTVMVGAGNVVTNSAVEFGADEIKTAGSENPNKLSEAMRTSIKNANGGGAASIIGNGNIVDSSTSVSVVGAKNEVYNTRNAQILASNRTIGTKTPDTTSTGDATIEVKPVENSVIIGSASVDSPVITTKSNVTILGYNANAEVDNGVALGSESVARTGAGDAGYDPTTGNGSMDNSIAWKATRAAVSIGNTDEKVTDKVTRQLTGLAAGTNDTDAVNVAQLRKLGDNTVQYDLNTDKGKITLGKSGTTITNVKSALDGAKDAENKNATIATATGDALKNAVNLGDLQNVYKEVSSKADRASASHTALTVEGNTAAGTKDDQDKDVYAGKNILLHESTDENGKVTYDLKLSKDINVGKPGKDGEDGKIGIDGKDGHIGLNGSDGITVRGLDGKDGAPGKDGVTITGPKGEAGKDGIDGKVGISGKDGKDAVSISGKDGVGHIGLTGPAGTNGMKGADGNPGTSIDITVKNGYDKDGVNGAKGVDGKDGITRIVYEDKNGEHQVATLEDGMKYAGDDAQKDATKAIAKKLNNTLDIIGGADSKNLTDKNIGVNSTDKGQLKVQLAKDLKGITSISNQTTTSEGESQTTTGAKITLGSDGNVDVNGGKVTNVNSALDGAKDAEGKDATIATATGDALKNAANLGDLQKVYNDVNEKADKASASHTALTVEDGTSAGTQDEKTKQDVYTGKNILLHESKDENGKVTYDLKLAKDINIGKPGKNGEDGKIGIDGKDGHIGLNGSNGISVRGLDGKDGAPGKDGVTITGPKGEAGKDGINGKVGISGKDGNDAVSISGKDGVGHIGLTGPAGTNGKDGTNAVDITVKNGYDKDGVNGAKGVDGKDGITRIVYEDKTGEHQVATLEDGMKYAGDNAQNDATKAIAKKLNNTLDIIGGADSKNLTESNIGVNSTTDGKLKVQLAKDLKGITSISNQKTEGDKTTGAKITLGADGNVDVNGGKITNVGSGIEKDGNGKYTVTDQNKYNAANVGDVQNIVNDAKKDLTEGANGLNKKANVDASNIGTNLKNADGSAASTDAQKANAEKWGSAIGTGKIEKDNGQLVTGKTVYDEVRPTADGSYVKKDKTTGENLSALDTQVKTNADNIAKNTESIQNITNNMQNLSENAVKYDGSDKSKVTLGGKDGTVITNVKDGALSENSKDAVNGKQLYNEQKAREAADKAITEKVTNNTNEITKIKNGDFTDASKTAIHNIAKDAVAVVNGKNTTVTKVEGTDTTPTTYAVNVEGTGKVAAGDTGLISGDTLYKEVHIDKDGAYIKGSQSVGQNLSNLDTGLKTTSDLIHTNAKGDTIQIGGNSTAMKVDISGKDSNGNTTGRVITGVVSDVSDPNSAANVGYVNGITSASNEQIYHDMNMQYNHVENDISRAAAGSNALAALHPMQEFDPDDKAQFALGYGHYRNSNAGAVGAFYQPDENSLFSFGVSFGNGDAGLNAGVTFKFGPGGSDHHALTKTQMAKVIDAQSKEIDELKKDNADKDKRIDALEQKMTEILAKLDKSKD